MATEHAFLVNCLHCGRILCEKESTEVCFACGSDPRTTPGWDNPVAVFFASETQGVAPTGAIDDSGQDTQAFERAIENQNEILQRQLRKEEMLKVYDEDTDYFSPTVWTTAEAREAGFKARQENLKRQQKQMDPSTYQIQLDLTNRNISVCSTIQSSLDGRQSTHVPPVGDAGIPEETCMQTLAERAVQRAVGRLELSRTMRIVEYAQNGACTSQMQRSSTKDEPRGQRVGPNPTLNTSIGFTPRGQSVPKWASVKEVQATEAKLNFLRTHKKVHVETPSVISDERCAK